MTLQTLVHHRRRVHRDLAAHDPVGMRARLVRRDSRQALERRAQEGPPDAVSKMRRTPAAASSPCEIAPAATARSRCARCRWAAGARRDRAPRPGTGRPAMTSASLFASSTRFPACAAANVAGSPAAPTIAAMTVSTCGSIATSTSDCGPARTWRGQRVVDLAFQLGCGRRICQGRIAEGENAGIDPTGCPRANSRPRPPPGNDRDGGPPRPRY